LLSNVAPQGGIEPLVIGHQLADFLRRAFLSEKGMSRLLHHPLFVGQVKFHGVTLGW
jgi:hypothetical protein